MTVDWVDIDGFEGLYQISNDGQVRSVNRTLAVANRWGTITERAMVGKSLKPRQLTNGYLGISLGANSKCHLIHRLVASAFIENNANKPQVNHMNGDRKDNRAANLEWVTCSENHKHSYAKLNRKKHTLTKAVVFIGHDGELFFESILAAANYFEVSAGSISSALLRNHKCLGYEVKLQCQM